MELNIKYRDVFDDTFIRDWGIGMVIGGLAFGWAAWSNTLVLFGEQLAFNVYMGAVGVMCIAYHYAPEG